MKLLNPDELEAELRDIGAKRYHRLHPFHGLLHGGKCTKGQVQAWALNRYYYQAMIPQKDASLIARCDDPAIRREWRSRLVDHDGAHEGDGGIARWLKLTDGLGLDRGYVTSLQGLLPGTKFAVEAYVHFVAEKTLLEAIASSLTELFSPAIIGERVEGMLKGYSFVTEETLAYFAKRPPPKTPQDLTDYNCINLRLPIHGGLYAWEFEKKGRELNVRVDGQLIFNTASLMLKAALDGHGLVYLTEGQVAPYLADGRLVRVLADWCEPFSGYHLYYPSRRQPTLAFALLVEALRYRR